MNNSIIKILALFVTIFAVFCQGCSKPENRSYTGPPAKIVIAIYKGELTSVVYIAEQFGYFKQMGLDVEFRDYESGAAAVAALVEGKVDLATGADFVFASNIVQHQDLRAVVAINSANNIFLVARRDRGINKPVDLKGKRIAVTLTTPGEYFLGKYLNYNRLKKDEVTIVNMTPTAMEKENAATDIDAFVVWNPVARRIKESLGANAVSWDAQSESSFHMLLIARDSFIKKESQAMVRLMKALILAEKSIASDPVKARQYIAKRIGMPEKYLTEVWGDYQFRIYLDRSLLLTLEDESRWISKARGLGGNNQPNYLNYLYLDALKAARPESVTIIN